MIAIGTTVSAAANGILPAVPWCAYTACPMKGCEVPMMPGMM